MKAPEQIAAELVDRIRERGTIETLDLPYDAKDSEAWARIAQLAIEADREQRPAGLEGTERIIHYWSRKHGDCEECSDPAAYLVLEAFGDGKHMLACSVCAAYQAAQGQALRKIEED